MSYNPPSTGVAHLTWDLPAPPADLVLRWDHAASVVAWQSWPGVGVHATASAYRGCTHGCATCPSRGAHGGLGLDAGRSFDRIVYVKRDPAGLLRRDFASPRWSGAELHLGGTADAYQPIERELKLSRAMLEVCVQHRNPVCVRTRSPLVLRDLDLLSALAAFGAVRVEVAVPISESGLCHALEPGAPSPAQRFHAVRALAEAGVPVGVGLGPLVPALTESTLARTVLRASESGAQWASLSPLWLPGAVEQVFAARLAAQAPSRADAVQARRAVFRASAVRGGPPGAWHAAQQQFARWCDKTGLMVGRPVAVQPSPFRRVGRGPGRAQG